MKIKVGKRYLTRDGRVAFVSAYCERLKNFYGVVSGDSFCIEWNRHGKRVPFEDSSQEIVALYKPKKRKPRISTHLPNRFRN